MALALAPAVARGDGDPASDVLATQDLFLPTDAGASARQQAQLDAVLAAAARRGYPLRVAVIASATDLGSVAGLWRQPRNYARFLGQELALVSKARVLVVMPDGFGLYHPGHAVPVEQAALRRLGAVGSGRVLLPAAISAVESLAQSGGHAIPTAVAATAQSARTNSSSGDALAWGGFAAGAALIALAWTASLRARPLRVRAQ